MDAETGCATKLSLRRGAAGTNAAPPPHHHPRPHTHSSLPTSVTPCTTKAALWMIMADLLEPNARCRADRASSRSPRCHHHHALQM